MKAIIEALESSAWHIEALNALRRLNLPDAAIGAGFVRNLVWDRLHRYEELTPLSDVDVVYFDPNDTSRVSEAEITAALSRLMPDCPWSVKNQARMHLRNGDRPYRSTEDALRFWLETPTAVAARLHSADEIEIMAPYGLKDLISMQARPTPRGRQKPEAYRQRMVQKNWPTLWPMVKIHPPDIVTALAIDHRHGS